MASAVNPLRSPDVFDTAKIAGIVTPGQAEVTGVKTVNNFDYWRGFGITNPQLIFKGREVKAFTLEIRIWDEADLDRYQKEIEPLLLKLPFKGRAGDGTFRLQAYDFSHPITNAAGIRSVCVGEVPQIEQVEDGLWSTKLLLYPFWGQPEAKVAKPIASGDDKPKPEDAADKVILGLADQISAQGKELEKLRGP